MLRYSIIAYAVFGKLQRSDTVVLLFKLYTLLPFLEFTQEEELGLAKHNEFRQVHQVPPMTLDRQMCDQAKEYAKTLVSMGTLKHSSKSEREGQGENLSMGCSTNAPQAMETAVINWYGVPGGRGDSHMKGAGMIIASLRGVKFRFWSQLGRFGQNAIIFSREGLVQGCMQRNIKICICVCSIVKLLNSALGLQCDFEIYHLSIYLGVKKKKAWATPRLVTFRGLIQNSDEYVRPSHMRAPAPHRYDGHTGKKLVPWKRSNV